MQHIILFYYFLSLAMGAGTILVAFLIYVNNRLRVIRYYIYLLINLTVFVMLNAFSVYRYYITRDTDLEMTLLTAILFIICLGFFILLIPSFFHILLDKPFKGILPLVFRAGSFVSIILVFIPFFSASAVADRVTIAKFLLYGIYSPMVLATVGYALVLLILNYKKILNKIMKTLIRNILLLMAVFLPLLFVLDLNTYNLTVSRKIMPFGLTLLPMFYLFWSLISIVYSARYLFIRPMEVMPLSETIEIPASFLEKYNITKREREIIELLFQSYSYNKIRETFFISMGTVKNHVHNIYYKTGTHGGDELKKLVRTFK